MSVFRTSRSAVPRKPYPDGPTEPIAEPPKARRNRGVLLALITATLALNLAGVAAVLAWRASAARPPVVPVAAGSAAPTVTVYSVSYAQEPLRVQVGCSAVMYLDLDEPRANAGEQVSDLRYDSRCGDEPPHLTLAPGAAGGAQVANADTDAAGCDKAIRTSPIGPGATVPVRKGVALCVRTAADPPEMALVEITEVGRSGTAGMRATSWKVSA